MSNGDHDYKHMVVCQHKLGETGQGMPFICKTSTGAPAVFHDNAHAVQLAIQLGEKWPEYHYNVIAFQVL